jgi:hypothetical protein
MQIDPDATEQRHILRVGANHPRRARPQPRQRRAQAHMRAPLGHRRPQHARRQIAPHRPPRQRHIPPPRPSTGRAVHGETAVGSSRSGVTLRAGAGRRPGQEPRTATELAAAVGRPVAVVRNALSWLPLVECSLSANADGRYAVTGGPA